MAKGEKSKLTIEDALVPIEEQPYEIPPNWCWIKFEALKNDSDSFYDGDWILGENMNPDGDVRLLQLSDIGIGEFLDKSDKHITAETFNELGCTELHAGDIMISRMAEPIARSCIVPEFDYAVITAVDVAVLRCNLKYVNNKYVNYLCNVKWFTDTALSMARGTTRIRITRANLGSIAVPLPPLVEQKRIVEQIENLFSKLDEAKEKAHAVVDGFETRKAAILNKAFSGELTAQWRKLHHALQNTMLSDIKNFSYNWGKKDQKLLANEQNKSEIIILDNEHIWVKCTIGAVSRVTNGSTPSRKVPEFWNGTIPWISSGEVKNNIINSTNECISQKGFDNSSVKMLPKGTVLIAMIGEGKTRGQSSVLNIQATINQNIAAVIIDHGLISPHYIWYWFQMNYTKNREKGAGSGPQALNCQRVRELDFFVPNYTEQKEIVRILEDLLTKEQQAKEAAEAVLNQIDTMKKSILARAFRGELGTNNPEEESSIELLKLVLKDRKNDGV